MGFDDKHSLHKYVIYIQGYSGNDADGQITLEITHEINSLSYVWSVFYLKMLVEVQKLLCENLYSTRLSSILKIKCRNFFNKIGGGEGEGKSLLLSHRTLSGYRFLPTANM